MIAATPDTRSRLGLLSVILQSVHANQPATISDSLKAHTVAVLHSAAQISANPRTIGADTLPEAIELAFKIQGDIALRRRLEALSAFDALGPEVADEILRSLHSVAA